MQSQADIVKKGHLRYKASKIKGTSGANIQGPKTYKDYFIVFRSINGGHKVMEAYQSEKKFQEFVQPKLTVDLDEAVVVEILSERKNFFYIEMTDGVMCLFEAKTIGEAQEWKSCLNAVLLVRGPEGDGILQYEVDVLESELLQYQGPAILELREKEGDLTIWTWDTHEQVVKWRLSHIRSFKAKKSTLTIYPGSRSSTGAKEFYFGCTNSVQVTHAIETVVAMLKTKKQRAGTPQDSQQSSSDRRPLPVLPPSLPPPLQTPSDGSAHIAIPELLEYSDGPDYSLNASIAANIPRFNPLEVYEDVLDENGAPPAAVEATSQVEEYHKLKHPKKPSHPVPNASLPPPPPEYGRLNVKSQSTSVISSRTSPKIPRKRFDYEEIPDPVVDGNDDYGKLGHNSAKINRTISTPAVPGANSDDHRRLERQMSPIASLKRSPPPQKPPPYKPKNASLAASEDMYSRIDDPRPKVRPYTVRHREKSPMKASLSRSNSDPDLISKNEYGALDHFGRTESVRRPPADGPEDYGRLDHQVQPKKRGPMSAPKQRGQEDEYGKLDHVHVGSRQPDPEEYGKLDHVHVGSRQPDPEEYGKLEHVSSRQTEEYGKLDHAVSGFSSHRTQPEEEYGKLDRTTENQRKFERPVNQLEELGRFVHGSSASPPNGVYRPSFDPYGTLTADDIDKTGGGGGDSSVAGPTATNNRDKPSSLPIYTDVDSRSGATPIYSEVNFKHASRKKQVESESPAPPPGYENTEIKHKETAAYKASYKKSTSPTAPPATPPRTQQTPKLKHGYVNIDGPAIPTERQHSSKSDCPVNVNGHSEEVHYDVGDSVVQNGTPVTAAPVPPRRGVSMQNSTMDNEKSSPTSPKPVVTPKPKVKPKPKLRS